jgi:DNA-binding PadR family transcriptional regulator
VNLNRRQNFRLTFISVTGISVTDMNARDTPHVSKEVQRLIPLTPAVFYVMLALSPGPKHGYAIMQETTTLSDGGFRMGPATLYSTIKRLVALDLINETTEGASSDGSGADARRRYYELTGAGRQLLELEVKRMSSVVKMANARLVQRRSEA